MNDQLLVTIEILFTIVLPLLALYLKGPWPLRSTIVCMVCIPVLWYPLYAPTHELSHVVGTYLVGGRVTEVKLIPRFWLGEVARAWVISEGITKSWQQLISTGLPYILDIVCVAAAIWLVKENFPKTAFFAGFTFMLLCLRPLFDLVCEGIAFALGGKGDLYFIGQILGSFLTWVCLLFSIGLALLSIVRVLRRYSANPVNSP